MMRDYILTSCRIESFKEQLTLNGSDAMKNPSERSIFMTDQLRDCHLNHLAFPIKVFQVGKWSTATHRGCVKAPSPK